MISRLEIYRTNSLNPYENLATEKYLLDTVKSDVLRIYLWQNGNTAVIGSNQNPWAECKCALLEAEGGFIARRLSGGGAVFHDIGNLNFTFICSQENYNLNLNLQIIKKACEYAGIPVEISGRNDILAQGKKFSGNAFYHTSGKAYHHGTVLISSETEKIKRYLTPGQEKLNAKGIKSVESRVVNLKQFNPDLTPKLMSDYLIKAAESVCGFEATLFDCASNQQIKDQALIFGSWDYIYGKTPPFTVSLNERFSWGDLEINLNLSGGKITEIKVFTDSMDFTLAEKIETALLGAQFRLSTIENRLKGVLDTTVCDDVLSVLQKAFMTDRKNNG